MQVVFGGVMNYEKERLVYRPNFRGCMENIAYNLIYITDLAKRRSRSIKVEVRICETLGWSLLPWKSH